jgi:cytochrome bd-type quinol oxidase subunit 1
MLFDPMLLPRLQFAWVIAWHIVLPAFTIAAMSFIAMVEGLALATARVAYARDQKLKSSRRVGFLSEKTELFACE